MHPAARHLPTLAGAALAALSCAHAAADEYDHRLATCEPVMTTIDRACEAQTYYVCPDAGRFSETIDTTGTVSIELDDAEMNPVYAQNPATGEGVRRVLSTPTFFSFSDLQRLGRSEGAFLAEIQLVTPFPRPAPMTLWAELTGEERTIGPVTFQVGRAAVGIGIGTGGTMAVSEGPILVDSERGLLIVESATMSFNGVTRPVGEDVTTVLLPGEPGFQPRTAPSSCGPTLSSLPQGGSHG